MPAPIHLKCHIAGCEQCYTYQFEEGKLVALNAQWRDPERQATLMKGLLDTPPEVGKVYELTLSGPLRIDLSQDFWVLYVDPSTTLDGLDSELGLSSFTFCLCRKESVVEVNPKQLRVLVVVGEKSALGNFTSAEQGEVLQVLEGHYASSAYRVINFPDFVILKINIQGDLGWTYLVAKQNSRYTVIAENIWDFHRDYWRTVQVELDKEQVRKYKLMD